MSTTSNAIRKSLSQLAKKPRPTSLMSEVAAALPEIEQALGAGASYAEICETFASHGVPITETVLRTYLYRLRKEQPNSKPPTVAKSAAPAKRAAKKTTARSAKR